MTSCAGSGVGVGVGGGGGTGVGTGVGSGVGDARAESFGGKWPAIHVRNDAGKMKPVKRPSIRLHEAMNNSRQLWPPLTRRFLAGAGSMNTVYGCAAGLRKIISVSTTPISASGTR